MDPPQLPQRSAGCPRYRHDTRRALGAGRYLKVTTAADGTVTGELTFSPQVRFAVTGKVHPAVPATETSPALPLVELTAVMGPVEYRLRGWMIPEQNVVAGTVVAISGDLRKASDGTAGSWVLALKD